MTVRGYRLGLDWSRAGTFANPYEDASVAADTDITISVGRDTSRAAADLPAGTLDFKLDDSARALAPDRAASPLYGKVAPGVPGRLDLTVSGVTTNLFSGSIDRLVYDPNEWSLSGTLKDAWGVVADQQISTAVYQGQRTGTLIGVILDEIGWPADARSIDPGATVVPYWWAEGKGAADAIQELADSEGPPAIAYVDRGVFVFEDRHHRIFTARSATSQALYTHIYPEGTGPGGDFKMLRNSISYDHGRSNIVNSAGFQVDVRAPGDTAVVWSTDTAFTVPAGTTMTILATANDPFVGALVEDSDYTLLGGSITVTLDRTSGQSLAISVTAGGTDATVATLQVRAGPLTVVRTVKVEAEDAGSVNNKGGRKSWDRPLPWAGPYDAQAIANRIVSTYAVARPVLTFTIDGAINSTYLAEFAGRRVSDRITVREDIVGLNTDFIVEKVTREITALGISSRLTIACELPQPTQAANAFIFDLAGHGFDDGAFSADGVDNATTAFRFDTAGVGFDQGVFAN
jgi:hypothetical protein